MKTLSLFVGGGGGGGALKLTSEIYFGTC